MSMYRDEVELRPFNPTGSHTANSALSSVVTLTAPAGANLLMLQANTKDVRVTLDGTDPDASTGFLIVANDAPAVLAVTDAVTVKVIEVAASAVLQYQWGN